MKILFLTNVPSPYRVDFFNELGKYCDLTVLFDRDNVAYRDKGWLSFSALNFKSIILKGWNVKNTKISFEIFQYLNDSHFDVIIIGGYSTFTGLVSVLYLKLRNIPFILNTDGGIIKNDNYIVYFIKKLLISKATAWLSSGLSTSKYLVHYGANEKRIYQYTFTSLKEEDILKNHVLPIDKDFIKEKLGIKESRIILSVSRFIPIKGNDVIIESLKGLGDNVGLYIVGGKPPKEYLDLREKLALTNVYFVDFMTKADLKNYYLAADIFVLATRYDAWGLVINEAMSFGLPVITTDRCVAGLELIENHENGYIIPCDNADLLRLKITDLLQSDISRSMISQKNLAKISDYTIEKMANQHIEIFESYLRELRKGF